MINVFVEGSSWPEVAQELRKMLGDEPKPSQDTTDLVNEKECVIEDLTLYLKNAEEQLLEVTSEYTNKVNGYEELLRVKDARIADLEKRLADAKAPQQAEPTEGDTEEEETPKPKKTTRAKKAPAPPEEEETTTPPEVTAEEEAEPEAPAKEIKKEEVRAVLVKCRAANIALTEILAPYGGSLGAVKKEDYAKVIADAEAALEGK